jgi:hypothetical protein
VRRETWALQRIGAEPWLIAVTQIEGDLDATASQYAAADDPFSRWFKDQGASLSAIDPNVEPLGPPARSCSTIARSTCPPPPISPSRRPRRMKLAAPQDERIAAPRAVALALVLGLAAGAGASAETLALVGGTLIDGWGGARSPTAWCWSRASASRRSAGRRARGAAGRQPWSRPRA